MLPMDSKHLSIALGGTDEGINFKHETQDHFEQNLAREGGDYILLV